MYVCVCVCVDIFSQVSAQVNGNTISGQYTEHFYENRGKPSKQKRVPSRSTIWRATLATSARPVPDLRMACMRSCTSSMNAWKCVRRFFATRAHAKKMSMTNVFPHPGTDSKKSVP